jgi:hypothetical protein
MSHFQDMPNPYALASNPPPRTLPTPIPVMVVAPPPFQPSWHLHPCYEPRRDFVLAQEVMHGCFPDYMPQNLVQEHNFCLEFPTSKEAELPDLDFGQWQHDTDVSFLTLGHDS